MKTSPKPKMSRVSRAKGRPEAAEGVGREALLQAAVIKLRSTTPEALTLASVANEADVHPALIRYYFGNKDGLLREVSRFLVESEHEVVRPKLESSAPLNEKISERLLGMIELVQANPHYHRLMLDKIYSKDDKETDEYLLGRITSRGLRLTMSMLHDSSTPPLRPIDPRFLHIALIGLAEFFVSAKPLVHELFGDDADLDELKVRYVDFLQSLILHGIADADSPSEAKS